MNEEQDSHIADIVAAATGQPGDTQEGQPTETEEETSEPADGEEEEPEGTDGDETEEEDEEPFQPDPVGKYAKVTDVKKLQGMLVSKDKGYAKMEPYAKIGEAFHNAMQDKHAVKALLDDIESTHGIKIAEVLSLEPASPAPSVDVDWREFESTNEAGETVNEAKDYFEQVVKKYTDQRVGSLEAKIAELTRELADPLTEYKGSREAALFEQRVGQAAPEALRIYKLRTQQEATKADLAAAMQRFPQEKPVDALQAFKALKAAAKPRQDADKTGPTLVRGSERKESRIVDPMEDIGGAMNQAVAKALGPHFEPVG